MLPNAHFNFKFKALLHYDIVLVPSKSVSNHTLLSYTLFCAEILRKIYQRY